MLIYDGEPVEESNHLDSVFLLPDLAEVEIVPFVRTFERVVRSLAFGWRDRLAVLVHGRRRGGEGSSSSFGFQRRADSELELKRREKEVSEMERREERGGGGGREGRTHVESVVVDDFCCGRVRVEMSRFLGFGELDSELRDQSLVF